MNKEVDQMKKHGVYEELSTDTVDQETLHSAIDSEWVHKNKTPTEVRSRIVAKGYKEEVEDLDDIYASTPLFVILRVLLMVAMARSWKIRLGDMSTISTCTAWQSARLHLATKRILPGRYYSLAPQEGNVRTTFQSEIVARLLCNKHGGTWF